MLVVEVRDNGKLLDALGQEDLPVVVMGWTGRGVRRDDKHGFQIMGRDNIVKGEAAFAQMRKIGKESGLWVRFRFSFALKLSFEVELHLNTGGN